MPSVLFVCTANQCRSPMAAALFTAYLERRGLLDQWSVASAGIWAPYGMPATPIARQVAREQGVNLDNHRSQPVTPDLLSRFNLVLVMETMHADELRSAYPQYADRVQLLTAMAGAGRSIEDPIGQAVERYWALTAEFNDLFARGFERISLLALERSQSRSESDRGAGNCGDSAPEMGPL